MGLVSWTAGKVISATYMLLYPSDGPHDLSLRRFAVCDVIPGANLPLLLSKATGVLLVDIVVLPWQHPTTLFSTGDR